MKHLRKYTGYHETCHVIINHFKPTLALDNMNNYQPMSNLSFFAEVLEKVITNHLNSHRNSSNKSNHYRCAHRKFHSTETALLKIHDDILSSLDDAGKVTALSVLDVFAAFNTIDHTILLRRLDDWFKVSEKGLDWSKLYLTGSCQRLKLGLRLSSKADLHFGVSQWLFLGSLLFTLYTTPLCSMISGHAISHHL